MKTRAKQTTTKSTDTAPNSPDVRLYRRLLRQRESTPEQIASIAAPLMQRHGGDINQAISEAVNLLGACILEVENISKVDPFESNAAGVTIPKPKSFPIEFDEMLRLLMPEVEKRADRIKRFRDYLSDTPVFNLNQQPIGTWGLIEAGTHIATFQGRPIYETEYWLNAQAFLIWWRKKLADKRRGAANQRREKNSLVTK